MAMRKGRIVLVAVVVLIVAATSSIVWVKTRPRLTVAHDYSPIMQYVPAGMWRYPDSISISYLGSLWPQARAEENAALLYLKAGQVATQVTIAPPPGSSDALGSRLFYQGDKKALEEWTALNAPALDVVRQALTLPTCQPPPLMQIVAAGVPPTPDVMYFVSPVRVLVRRLADAAFVDELNGRYDEAVARHLDGLRMSKQIERDGYDMVFLVGTGIAVSSVRALHGLVANRSIEDDALRRTIEQCRAAEVSPGEMEEVLKRGNVLRDVISRTANPNAALRGVTTMILRSQVQALDKKYAEAILPVNAELRLEQIEAAIKMYERKHGVAPGKLDELVPEYLPAVPEDPFAKAPLNYAPTDYGWKIWSVGLEVDPLNPNAQAPITLRSKTLNTEQVKSGYYMYEQDGKLVTEKIETNTPE
jgi:hypothetical protein